MDPIIWHIRARQIRPFSSFSFVPFGEKCCCCVEIMELIKSNMDKKPKLCFAGYMYNYDRTCTSHVSWRCNKRKSLKCRGTLISSLENDNPVAVNQHNHPADEDSVCAEKSVQVMKKRIKDTLAKPSQIFAEEVHKLEDSVKSRIPPEEQVKRTLRNHKTIGNPKNPASLQELSIEGNWTLTGGPEQERFLLVDNKTFEAAEDEGRIIIFSTDKLLEQLARASAWYLDGNFPLAPPLFQQLYIVRAKNSGIFLTTAYAILQRKTGRTYEAVFRYIMQECEQRNLYPDPQFIYLDFEKAAINAAKSVLGEDISIRGCFYHLRQSTYRKVQQLGMQNQYLEDQDFSKFVGMVDEIAFLPLDRVVEGMNFLRNHPGGDLYAELLDYFDQTYVSGTYRRVGNQEEGARFRRIPPLFPPEAWNVHEAVMARDDKTNNSTEGWNNRFSHLVGMKHPSIWVLITKMQQELSVDYTKLQQFNIRPVPRPRIRPAYSRLQEILRNLCIEFQNDVRDIEQFLTAVSHNIRMYPN